MIICQGVESNSNKHTNSCSRETVETHSPREQDDRARIGLLQTFVDELRCELATAHLAWGEDERTSVTCVYNAQ